jgi:glutamate synthase domain-containing protein 2
MPLRESMSFISNALIGFNLRKEIKIIASRFHLVKNIILGADACNSASGMMIALGCVQSLTCHAKECAVGVATQDPTLAAGIVVKDKSQRIALYYQGNR